VDPADLVNRFTYHPPQPEQIKIYEAIRRSTLALALEINQFVPDSREKSLALTHLEDVVYCANAAVARHA
jgi:hypothetical protein